MSLLNVKEAAKYLGVSLRSMARLIAEQEIEIIRLPGIRRNLFRTEDLEKLIKESRISFSTVPAIVPTSGHNLANSGNGRHKS